MMCRGPTILARISHQIPAASVYLDSVQKVSHI